jgi:aryl-alcohol dehydrogenase-like predicted oxidoreductase
VAPGGAEGRREGPRGVSRRRIFCQDRQRWLNATEPENFTRNLRIADEVRAVADQAGATPAQVALAWLLAKGHDIVPIPGTKRVSRVEENIGADGVTLTADQIATLDKLSPAEGDHHTEAQMQMIER